MGVFVKNGTGGPVVAVDKARASVEEGNAFTLNALAAIASGSALDLLISTNDRRIELEIEARAEGKAYFQSFIGVDAVGGTPIIPFNRSSDGGESGISVVVNPTINDLGTQRGNVLIPASSGFFTTSGASYSGKPSSIGPNRVFLLRISNEEGTGTDDLNFILDWLESEG